MYKSKPTEKKSTPLTIFNIHFDNSPRQWNCEIYYILSIDPGSSNLGIRLESRHAATGEIQTVKTDQTSITCGSDGTEFRPEMIVETTRLIESYASWFPYLHFVLIEHQMSIGFINVRISQHIITLFSLYLRNLPNRPYLIEQSAFIKHRELFSPPGLNRNALKKWTCEKAKEMLKERNDVATLGYIQSLGKLAQRDLCDVICMIEGFWRYTQREGIIW